MVLLLLRDAYAPECNTGLFMMAPVLAYLPLPRSLRNPLALNTAVAIAADRLEFLGIEALARRSLLDELSDGQALGAQSERFEGLVESLLDTLPVVWRNTAHEGGELREVYLGALERKGRILLRACLGNPRCNEVISEVPELAIELMRRMME